MSDEPTCGECRSFKRYKRWPRLGVCLRVFPPYMRAKIDCDHVACPRHKPRTKRQLAIERKSDINLPIDELPLFKRGGAQ